MKTMMYISIMLMFPVMQGCGLADPKVVYDDHGSEANSQEGQGGTRGSENAEVTDGWSKAHSVFTGEMSGVVRSYCVNCHGANHSVPFKSMTDEGVCDKLETLTSCDAADFKNFLQNEHPGGNISKRFATAIEQRFRANDCFDQ
jgi:hypothetical protein